MNEDLPPSPCPGVETVFPIAYPAFFSRPANEDLRGNGLLTVQNAGAEFCFAGRKRNPLALGRDELRFTADDISNVVVDGRKLSFSTLLGRSGRRRRPFVFFCRDAGDANAVAALLPKRLDENFTARRDFDETLRNMPGAAHPACSVTNLIIGANVVVFLIMAGLLGGGWVETTDLTPYILYGANNGAATTDGEWWRLITAMFLHYGIMHLALNMWALFQTGHLVEKLLGRAAYTLTYFAAGIGGGLLSLFWHGDKVWSVGASGAIFGIYGALLGYMLREKQAIPRPVYQPLLKSTLMFAGYNLLYGFAHPEIDNSAHIGGLVVGALFGWILALPLSSPSRAVLMGRRLQWGSLALLIMVAAGVATAPRFPYVVKDELAWEAKFKEFGPQETALIARQNAEVLRLRQKDGNATNLTRLIEKEMVPFYEDFELKLNELSLTPNRLTDRRRQLLIEYAVLKEDSLRHLARGLRTNDRIEFKAQADLEAKAKVLVETLKNLKN